MKNTNSGWVIFISGAGLLLFFLVMDNLAGMFGLLNHLLQVIRPLLIGFCLAYVINIPLRFLERKVFTETRIKHRKLQRILSMVCVLILAVFVLALILYMIVPQLIQALVELQETLPGVIDRLINWMNGIFERFSIDYIVKPLNEMDPETIINQVYHFLFNNDFDPLNTTLGLASSLIEILTTFFLSIIFALYLCFAKESLGATLQRIAQAVLGSERTKKANDLLELTDTTFRKFIVGQLTECFILGSIFFVGMTILGFPYASMISVLVGTFALVPIIGGITAMLIGVILVASINPELGFWFYIFNQTVQQIENDIIYPKVVGQSVGLPAVYVLMSVLIFGDLFGAFGMIVAVPSMSLIYTLVSRWVNRRLNNKEEEIWIESDEIQKEKTI